MRLLSLADAVGQYGAIYADPPWAFEVWSKDTGQGRSAEAHYNTMSTVDIAELPVVDLAAPNCVLFLWTTWPHLPVALEVGAAWGFEFKTCGFLWAKQRKNRAWHMGMGYWTRANSEPCLLFTRGTPKRRSASVGQLMVADIGRHSAKPLDIYGRIAELVNGPYLELFARRHPPGWDVWGNESPDEIEVWQEELAVFGRDGDER